MNKLTNNTSSGAVVEDRPQIKKFTQLINELTNSAPHSYEIATFQQPHNALYRARYVSTVMTGAWGPTATSIKAAKEAAAEETLPVLKAIYGVA